MIPILEATSQNLTSLASEMWGEGAIPGAWSSNCGGIKMGMKIGQAENYRRMIGGERYFIFRGGCSVPLIEREFSGSPLSLSLSLSSFFSPLSSVKRMSEGSVLRFLPSYGRYGKARARKTRTQGANPNKRTSRNRMEAVYSCMERDKEEGTIDRDI